MSTKQVTKKIKRAELDFLRNDLPKLKEVRGTVVALAVQSLNRTFESEMAVVRENQTPKETPSIIAYREEVGKAYDNALFKDGKGVPLKDPNGKTRLKDPDAFNAEILEILERHPEAKEQIQAHEKEYEAFVEEEIEITFDGLTKGDLPSDLNFFELELLQKYFPDLEVAQRKLQK